MENYQKIRNEIIDLLGSVFDTFNEHIAPEGLMMYMYMNQFNKTKLDINKSISNPDELEPKQLKSLCEYGFLSEYSSEYIQLYDVYFLDIESNKVEDIFKQILNLASKMGNSKINIVVVDFCFNESNKLETLEDLKLLDVFENYLANKQDSKKVVFYSMDCTQELLSTNYINSIIRECEECNNYNIEELTDFNNIVSDEYVKKLPKCINLKSDEKLTVEQLTALSFLTMKDIKFVFSSNEMEYSYYTLVNKLFTGRYFFSKDIFKLYNNLVGTPVIVSKGNPCKDHLLYGIVRPTDLTRIIKYYPINIAISDIHIDSLVHAIGSPETLDLDEENNDIVFLGANAFDTLARKYKKVLKSTGRELELAQSLQELLNRIQRIALLKNMSPLRAVSFKEIAIFLKGEEFYFTVIPDYLNRVKVEIVVDNESLVKEVPIENIYPTQCVYTLNEPIDFKSEIYLPELRPIDMLCIAWGMNPRTNSKNKAYDTVKDPVAILYMLGIGHSKVDTEFLQDIEKVNRTMLQNLSIGDDGKIGISLQLMHTI